MMQPDSKPIRLSTTGKTIAVALVVALTIYLLHEVHHILAPFIAAIIVAYLFNPLISLLYRRTGVSRALWILVLYVLAFALLYGVATLIVPRITAQYNSLVEQRFVIVQSIQGLFQQFQRVEFGGFVIDLAELEAQVVGVLNDILRSLPTAVPGLVFTAIESVVYLLVFMFVTFYLLLQSEQLMRWIYGLVPDPYRAEIMGLGHDIDGVLGAYIRGQLVLIVIMSVLLYIPLSILGVRYALVIAIISGVLEIVPFLGPWTAAGIAVAAALIQGHAPFGLSGPALAGVIGLIYLTLRLLEDNFIIPTLVGHFVKLHPTLVIFAALAGAALAGPFGLLVGIPVAAVIRILLSYLYRKLVDAPEPVTVTITNPEPAAPSLPPPPTIAPPAQAPRPRKGKPTRIRQ
jgi:predicted PurR-regulated permease PerM